MNITARKAFIERQYKLYKRVRKNQLRFMRRPKKKGIPLLYWLRQGDKIINRVASKYKHIHPKEVLSLFLNEIVKEKETKTKLNKTS